jgi:hypothetical protein
VCKRTHAHTSRDLSTCTTCLLSRGRIERRPMPACERNAAACGWLYPSSAIDVRTRSGPSIKQRADLWKGRAVGGGPVPSRPVHLSVRGRPRSLRTAGGSTRRLPIAHRGTLAFRADAPDRAARPFPSLRRTGRVGCLATIPTARLERPQSADDFDDRPTRPAGRPSAVSILPRRNSPTALMLANL